MIDPENEVIDFLTDAILAEVPEANISSVWEKSPSSFPHVSIWASDSHNLGSRWDSGNKQINVFTFHVNAYSAKPYGKREECKKIMHIVDDVLSRKNFRRESITALPNMEDNSIYRLAATYIVATDGEYFYRR